MASVNKMVIVGKLGKDVESKSGQSTSYAFFSVATDDYVGKGADGKAQTETTWHDVKAFGKTADYIGKFGKKGGSVFVEGRVQKSKDDKGGIHYNVVATQVILFGSKDAPVGDGGTTTSSAQAQGDSRGASRGAAATQASTQTAAPAENAPATVAAATAAAVPAGAASDEDDLPF